MKLRSGVGAMTLLRGCLVALPLTAFIPLTAAPVWSAATGVTDVLVHRWDDLPGSKRAALAVSRPTSLQLLREQC